MKLTALVVGLFIATIGTNAQGFSPGWIPGQQAVTTAVPSPHASLPVESSSGLLNNVLTSGPVSSLFAKLGINITKTLEKPNYWDERIPLITDDNYQDIIVNEPLSDEEEQARTWALIITVTAGDSPRDGISKFMDEMFDEAYNQTLIIGDLPDVRWGRIDYFNVTYLTTKWNIWSAPFLVILRNRGQELRFYRGQNLRLKEEELRNFLKAEDWKYTTVWSSSYSPGGSREFVLHYFATAMAKVYNLAVRVPRWLFVILSGMLGSILLSTLHSPPRRSPAPPPSTAPPSDSAPQLFICGNTQRSR
ncbi:hypothetical protein JOM56_008908 [Amanita muscaria]